MKLLVFLALILGLFGCAKEDIELTIQNSNPLPYKDLIGKKFESVGDLQFRMEVYEVVTYFYLPHRRIDKTEYDLQRRFYKIDNEYYVKWNYQESYLDPTSVGRIDKLKEI